MAIQYATYIICWSAFTWSDRALSRRHYDD